MNDFLSQLKRPTYQLNTVRQTATEEVFFLIGKDETGAYVATVNKNRKEIDVDYRSYNGEVFNVLRSLAAIREKNQLQMKWEGESERIYLYEYDYLIYQLLRCNNLLDDLGKPLMVSDHRQELSLKIEQDGKQFKSTFHLPLLAKGIEECCFLSDSFVMCEGSIYPMNPLGEGFRQLSVFTTTFAKEMLEIFLSVFYSCLQHINVEYDDYEIVSSSEEIETVPAVIFEKIDVDKALFMRVTSTLPHMDHQITEQFELTCMATLNDLERKIVLKRIIYQSTDTAISQLYKTIVQYAPNKEAKKAVFLEDNFFIVPQETAGPFLLHSLPQLVSEFVLMGAEKLREYKVKVYKPQLKMSLSSGIDFLEGDVELTFDDEKVSLIDALAQFRKKKYVLLSDGNRAVVDDSYIQRLERLFKKTKEKKMAISFFDLPEVEDMLNEKLEGEVFVKHRALFEGFNGLAASRLAMPSINAELRAYQYEGFKWINYLYDNNMGGCLADDMGLGKTIQTITMLARIYPKTKQPSLIVMPRSLLFNWQKELERFAPQLSVYTYYGSTREWNEAKKHNLILTTYALVRNDVELFNKQKFHYIILDESQNIKNLNAQTTQAVMLQQAKHRLALSGTPIENNLTELYSLFRFLNPAMFGTLDDFNRTYGFPIQKNNDKEAMQSLRRKIYPFILRRLKKDVLTELPDRMEQTLYVEMNPDQQKLYEERRLYYYQQVKTTIAAEGVQKSQFVMFQAMNELRRIASVPESMSEGRVNSSKLDLLMDYVTEAVSNGHKVIIFFNYIAGIELVSDKLNEEGIDFVSMTGSTRDRQSLVERFQNDRGCKVFLMTLKTGGVGLNLTAADTVFIFEPWWNKAAEEQAINRTHRIGQTNKVLSYSVITRHSIEEKIRLLQEQKAELFENLIGNDNASSKSLSEEEIDFILG